MFEGYFDDTVIKFASLHIPGGSYKYDVDVLINRENSIHIFLAKLTAKNNRKAISDPVVITDPESFRNYLDATEGFNDAMFDFNDISFGSYVGNMSNKLNIQSIGAAPFAYLVGNTKFEFTQARKFRVYDGVNLVRYSYNMHHEMIIAQAFQDTEARKISSEQMQKHELFGVF